jgi:pyruvate kinase
MISRFHPKVKIIPVVHHEISLRKMLLGYGCFPVNIGTSFDDLTELVDETIKVAKDAEHIKVGQEIVYIAGSPLWTVGEANLIQIRKID